MDDQTITLTIDGTRLHRPVDEQALSIVDDETRAHYERTIDNALRHAREAWTTRDYQGFTRHLAELADTIGEVQHFAAVCADKAGYDALTARARELLREG